MKQETLRKLRHRIIAGLLCCSILIAGQPNVTGLSMLRAAETEAEEQSVGNLNLWTGENQRMDSSTEEETTGMPNGADADEDHNRVPDRESEAYEEQNNTESVPEEGRTETIPKDASAYSNGSGAGAGMKADPLMTDAVFYEEPQNGDTHQHSVSVDCSVTAGEQAAFTELNQDFTGGALAEGNYYLSEDVTLTDSLVVSGTVKLCLNGHTLAYGGNDIASVIVINKDNTLYICDCMSGGQISGGKKSGIYNMGTLQINGGAIIENTAAPYGGGVFNNGLFEMNGGTIAGNTAHDGGGIYIDQGELNLYGGTITSNKAANNGGGICVSKGRLKQFSGEISGNTAVRGGGGIYCSDRSGLRSNYELNGGKIFNNTAKNGGGLYMSYSTFHFTGGKMTGNTAERGGGVYMYGGVFQQSDGEISNNKTTANASGYPANGGGIYFYAGSDTEYHYELAGGKISDNTAEAVGGGVHVENGTFEMSGGEISGNTAEQGGGVNISMQHGEYILNNGKISNNYAKKGGGVYCLYTFKMYNGEITNNIATEGYGGGLAINNYNSGNAMVELNNGTISNNRAEYGMGGGVYGRGGSKIKISSCNITNNTAMQGGGVGIEFVSIFELSGAPVIDGNMAGDERSNLYFPSNTSSVIPTITSSMTEGAKIGVSYMNTKSNSITTNVPFAKPAEDVDVSDYARFFYCDIDGFIPAYKSDPIKGLYFEHGVTIFYDYDTNGGDFASHAYSFTALNSTIDISPDAENAVTATKKGWEFLGWNTDPDATEPLEDLMTGRENITLYAIYKKTITVSFYSGIEKQKVDQTITLYNREKTGNVTTPSLEDMPAWQAVGWNISTTDYAGGIPAGSAIPVSEDCDYYGIYQQPVTVSYDVNGGTPAPGDEKKNRYANVHNSITYQNPTVILPPAVTRTGYTFTGWRQGSSSGTVKRPDDTVELTGNTTFYADWIADSDRSYVVEHYWQNVTGDGYSRIDTIPYTGTVGMKAEAEVRTYIGFTENPEHASRIPAGIIAEDGSLVLRLYYDRNTYIISFDLNGAEGIAPASQIVRYGGCAGPVLNPVRDGYTFTGWYMEDTGAYSLWNFADTVENNIRNSQSHNRSQSRAAENTAVVLYAGWKQNQSDQNQSDDDTTEETTDTTASSSDTTSNNAEHTTADNSTENETSAPVTETPKKTVPGTGDAAPIRLYATATMVGGLSYLLLEFADRSEMTEEKKRLLTGRLIQWAKKGGIFRRLFAALLLFLILAYYHAIGKQLMLQHSFSEKH